MKKFLLLLATCGWLALEAQPPINIEQYPNNGAKVKAEKGLLTINWDAGSSNRAEMVLDLHTGMPLISRIASGSSSKMQTVIQGLDPVFILRVGKRTLSPESGGWDVFFDKVPERPYTTQTIQLEKSGATVTSRGAALIVKVQGLKTEGFSGHLEFSFYNGSPLFNIAAVIATQKDSTAILYDAGLVNKKENWQQIAWADVQDELRHRNVTPVSPSVNQEVKYRTIIGMTPKGSLAVFPAPHQYFYPLDEAFNLKFTWYGKGYLDRVDDFGIGIRQEPEGDHRYVPWFNAPPNTDQRLNFFCLVSNQGPESVLKEVKRYTHNDRFAKLLGYKTFASHFHNEFIITDVMPGKPVPEKPEFVDVLKDMGLDIVKLAEFHMGGHPRGPDSIRLVELKALFDQTRRLSDKDFLLLPGEEANNFYGGHWLAFFPKPIYWIMSRKPEAPFETEVPGYGKVYRVGNKEEMLRLLEKEQGLAWVAHARTKGSTGYPDKYKDEDFFKSDTYFGAAWKAIPADLSWPSLSHRVLDLMDDMANWGYRKYAIGESDMFTITFQNEMYAHVNVTYLKLDQIPDYRQGWAPVLDAMRQGKFFVSTGELLIPSFSVNGKTSGEVLQLKDPAKAVVEAELDWTFPLRYVEIVSGDGHQVYRQKINLEDTRSFGKQQFSWPVDLTGKKWVRIEGWDIAANGAYTPMVWLK
ncbi:hypothetical protein GCM10027051_07680 [Niabella terrae]